MKPFLQSLRKPAWCCAVLLVSAACARTAPAEPPPPPLSPELARLPAGAIAVVRVDVAGPAGQAAAKGIAELAGDRLGCLVELLPSLERVALGFVARGREFAALLLLDGTVSREAVDRCGTELAKAFAVRPRPEGSSPVAQPANRGAGDAANDAPGSWSVAVDLDVDREATGLRGPIAEAYSRLATYPVVVAVSGGEALRSLSGLAATYLPLSSMGEAADRIVALAYGIAPRPDGSATARLEVELTDAASAESLARQVRQVGRITALDGEQAAWGELRGMVHDLRAQIVGRRVIVDGTLTPDGLAGLLR